MTNRSLYKKILLIIVFIFFLPHLISANPLSIGVIPERTFPGDVFIVKVRAKLSPTGIFKNEKLRFYQVSDDNYISIASIDIDIIPGKYKVLINAGEKKYEQLILVNSKQFPVLRLSLPKAKVFLNEKDRIRAEKEKLRLSKIWKRYRNPFWNGRFIPPIDTEISAGFGIIRIMNNKKRSIHRGIDYRGSTGSPVRAINSGVVVLTDDLFFGGNTVVIDHGLSIYSVYMHLSGFAVKEGDKIKRGDVIGSIGSSGRATGPHLHLSVKVNGRSINPESLFALVFPIE